MIETEPAPVSVVIPCYKCADTIDRAVASVYAQTWRPAEVILVDDCSGEGTLHHLYGLEREYPDGWLRVIALNKNDGPGTARNAGWEQATQQYIAFLDADDAWHFQKIHIQARWMMKNPDVALTGHASMVLSDDGDSDLVRYSEEEVQFNPISPRQLLASNRFPTRSVMLKRNLRHRFAPGKRYIEDFLLWCEVCLDDYPCFRSNMPLAFAFKADYGEGGLSGNLWKMQKGEMDVYRRLWFGERITSGAAVIWILFSVAKYARRIVINLLSKGARS